MRQLTVSGTTYDAALKDFAPVAVKTKGFGRQVTLEVEGLAAYEALVDLLAVAACDNPGPTAEAIYKDIERADTAA